MSFAQNTKNKYPVTWQWKFFFNPAIVLIALCNEKKCIDSILLNLHIQIFLNPIVSCYCYS